jgi:3-isopropylmalate/(R)-2-methylmalate dehydratase small subunit
LPIVLPEAVVAGMLSDVQARPGSRIAIDLADQVLTGPGNASHAFDIDPFSKHCLLNGLDELDYTLSLADRIAEFERRFEDAAP